MIGSGVILGTGALAWAGPAIVMLLPAVLLVAAGRERLGGGEALRRVAIAAGAISIVAAVTGLLRADGSSQEMLGIWLVGLGGTTGILTTLRHD